MKKVFGIIAIIVMWTAGIVLTTITGGVLGGFLGKVTEKIVESTFGTTEG